MFFRVVEKDTVFILFFYETVRLKVSYQSVHYEVVMGLSIKSVVILLNLGFVNGVKTVWT